MVVGKTGPWSWEDMIPTASAILWYYLEEAFNIEHCIVAKDKL